jgi:hypothetical protein
MKTNNQGDVKFDPEHPEETTITISISSNTRSSRTHYLSSLFSQFLKEKGFENVTVNTVIKDNDCTDYTDKFLINLDPVNYQAIKKANVVIDLKSFYKPIESK